MGEEIDFTRLVVPPEDGDVVVEPQPRSLRRLLEKGAEWARQQTFEIAGRSLDSWRREVRVREGILAPAVGISDDRPIVVLGHQPEFMHPGVFAKYVVASRLAQASGGVAANLVVDNDVPKVRHLLVPVVEGDRMAERYIPVVQGPAGTTYETLASLAPAAIAEWQNAARDVLGPRYDSSLLPAYFNAFAGTSNAGDFVDQAIAGQVAIHHILGLQVSDHRVSQLWLEPLLLEVFAHPHRFFECYNAALAEYRSAHGIAGTTRPIPDLQQQVDRLELPFWLLAPTGQRYRLFVEQGGPTIRLFAGNAAEVPHLEEGSALPKDHLSAFRVPRSAFTAIRPRALTLTLWARLFLADLFIHGIGGAKYDRITDSLIRRYFGCEPPPMACVSATLRLDLPRSGVTPEQLRQARRFLRDLTCNPQRHLTASADIDELLRRRTLAASESTRLRQENPSDHPARRETFRGIREINQDLLAARPRARSDAEKEVVRLEAFLRDDHVAARRDYFIGLFTEAKVRQLCVALPPLDAFRL